MEVDDVPLEQDNLREALVHERLHYCDPLLPNKTKLVSYAGKNGVEQPKLKLSGTNEGDPDYVTYFAMLKQSLRERAAGQEEPKEKLKLLPAVNISTMIT